MQKFLEMYRETLPGIRNEQVLQLCAISPANVPVTEIIAQYKAKNLNECERNMLKKLLVGLTSEETMEVVNEL